ncbi:MAG: hypothetical protein QW577_02555 [Candidatus Bathyarchaeia archaeon]
MGFIGNVVKAILVVTVVCWLYLVIEFVVMEQYALALFLSIGLLITSSIMLYEYRKSKKSEEKNTL